MGRIEVFVQRVTESKVSYKNIKQHSYSKNALVALVFKSSYMRNYVYSSSANIMREGVGFFQFFSFFIEKLGECLLLSTPSSLSFYTTAVRLCFKSTVLGFSVVVSFLNIIYFTFVGMKQHLSHFVYHNVFLSKI
jgi:hypothetical protein